MRKIQVIISILFLSLILSLFPTRNALAFSCVPKVTVDTNNNFNIIVNFGSIAPGVNDKDWLLINNQKISGELTSNRDLIFQIGKLPPGDYPFSQQTNNAIVCRGTVTVPDVGQGGSTSVSSDGKGNMEFTPTNPTAKDNISVSVKNLAEDGNYILSLSSPTNPAFGGSLCLQSVNKQVTFTLNPIPGGTWKAFVSKNGLNTCSSPFKSQTPIVNGTIIISNSPATAPILIPTPTPTGVPSPCAEGCFIKEKCICVDTAIGKISTEPQKFVQGIFGIVLGIAGGIALILIMISGYKFMASQGNPEALTAARDQLLSAIIGLLFIIFSFVILQIIGVDILRIPGFNP